MPNHPKKMVYHLLARPHIAEVIDLFLQNMNSFASSKEFDLEDLLEAVNARKKDAQDDIYDVDKGTLFLLTQALIPEFEGTKSTIIKKMPNKSWDDFSTYEVEMNKVPGLCDPINLLTHFAGTVGGTPNFPYKGISIKQINGKVIP